MTLTPDQKKYEDERARERIDATNKSFFLGLLMTLRSFFRSILPPIPRPTPVRKLKFKKKVKKNLKKMESEVEEWESNALTPQTAHPQHPTFFHAFTLHSKEIPSLKEYLSINEAQKEDDRNLNSFNFRPK